MERLLTVMLGGAIGAGIRYALGAAITARLRDAFPWGTLIVNLLGCLAMGLLAGTLARSVDGNEPWRLFGAVGILGGFTTFSAFSLETIGLVERGQTMLATTYIAASVIGSLAALAVGLTMARAL